MYRSIPLILALLPLVGCQGPRPAAGPLPTFTYRTPEQAMDVLAERARSLRTVSAAGTLELRGPGGRSTTLDAALAAAGGDRLRLRAWKFNQAVLDLTLNRDGLWLWTAEQAGTGRGRSSGIEPTAERLARAWAVVSGKLLRDPPGEVADRGGSLVARYEAEDGKGAVIATIDAATLTVRRYLLLGPGGRPRLTLTLDRYAMVDGRPWPLRLIAATPRRTLTLGLHEVALNTPLPPGAFTPPRRATRRP